MLFGVDSVLFVCGCGVCDCGVVCVWLLIGFVVCEFALRDGLLRVGLKRDCCWFDCLILRWLSGFGVCCCCDLWFIYCGCCGFCFVALWVCCLVGGVGAFVVVSVGFEFGISWMFVTLGL